MLGIVAIVARHKSHLTTFRRVAIITRAGMEHYGETIRAENRMVQLTSHHNGEQGRKASLEELIKAIHDT